jgi:fumarylpyruvate hydrolase
MAKGFDHSAVIGALSRHRGASWPDGQISASIDGTLRQSARLSDMIWPVASLLAHLSALVTLAPGDLVMTGTPAGVGPIARGETCTVRIDGLDPASVTIQ